MALARVWRSYGVLPDITIGHSLGEVGAAYVAGAITLDAAVAVVAARAGVVDRLTGRYAVAALGIDAAAAQDVIAATPGWLELSVVNSGSSVAVSGDRDAVSVAVAAVRDQGRFAREIAVGFPVHTSILEPLRDDLQQQLPQSTFADTPVQFIGAATGDVVPAGTAFPDYWYGNLRRMVRFDRAFTTALRCGATTFIELSTHPALMFAMGELLGDGAAVLIGSGRRDASISETLSAGLAVAAVSDSGHDWRLLVSGPELSGVPNAPMRATPMWAVSEPLPEVATVTVAHESWQPAPLDFSPYRSPVSVAVVEFGAGGPLGAALRRAVDRHPGVTPAAGGTAELTVLVAPSTGAADSAAATAEIAALVEAGVLRYPAGVGFRCRDVWLVTVAAEQVRDDDVVSLSAAATAAMHRSLALENPDLEFHHLDLPHPGVAPDAVIETLLAGSGELALRISDGDAVRYRRGLTVAPAAPAWPLHTGVLDDVVITGGAGAVGRAYARYLAECGARRIVLLGRRAAHLAGLAPDGTEVVSVRCDITDRDSIAAAAAEFAGGGASLLIHTAGAATFAPGDRIDAAAVRQTFAAKVGGLAAMTELWPLRPDTRIVLCSSVSGLWGGQGHAAYAAANRMLDAMAGRLRKQGVQCVAVRWGLWQSADGASGIVDAAETARIQRSGLRPMAPEPAIEASLRDHPVDPVVFSADTTRLRTFLHSSEPVRPHPVPRGTGAPPSVPDALRGELAAVLAVPDVTTIDLDASLFDLGVDSLLALELRKRLRHAIGRTVPLAILLGDVTGRELVAQLAESEQQPTSAEKVDVSE